MGARSEALAKAYEAKVDELTAAIENCSDADWKKTTAAEKWAVGVMAHHVAGSHEGISGLIKAMASGQQMPAITMAMIDEGNAKHAKDFANVTKAETLALAHPHPDDDGPDRSEASECQRRLRPDLAYHRQAQFRRQLPLDQLPHPRPLDGVPVVAVRGQCGPEP